MIENWLLVNEVNALEHMPIRKNLSCPRRVEKTAKLVAISPGWGEGEQFENVSSRMPQTGGGQPRAYAPG
jgi:hypothetical protein